MATLFLWLWLASTPVPDDWEAVNRALAAALEQVSLDLPETLLLQPQVAGEPHQWVLEPLLHRHLQETRHRILAPAPRVLEFRPLQVRIQKHRIGWWHQQVERRVVLKLWLGLRDPASGTYLWQQTLRGTYRDTFPLALEPETRVEGLSPTLQDRRTLWRDLAATLAVGGLVFLLYSGGHGP